MPGDAVIAWVVKEVVNPLFQLGVTCTFVYFLYGMVKFILALRNGDDPQGRKEGQAHMIYGLIGLFIVFSIGGFLAFMQGLFGDIFKVN